MVTIEHYDIDGNELWWLNEGPGAHADEPQDSGVVETALKGRFRFAAETETEDGLRRPQLGALHAILAYRSTEEHEPITVVMPTGTGKTETMLAAYCHSPARTLVVVPSDPATIQHRAIHALSAEDEWEIVIDDDGAGELADVVLLKRTEDALEVLMVHCKYSSGDKPGARIDDLYDVCGQSMKMNRAKSIPELLTKRLPQRAAAPGIWKEWPDRW